MVDHPKLLSVVEPSTSDKFNDLKGESLPFTREIVHQIGIIIMGDEESGVKALVRFNISRNVCAITCLT